jgi:sugar phosphate permease
MNISSTDATVDDTAPTCEEGSSNVPVPLCPHKTKSGAFILTYWSYALMKSANKSYSLIQPILIRSNWFSSTLYNNGEGGQTQMIGLISTLFLCCYASGQFFVGTLADTVNLRYFIFSAMIVAGLLTTWFGLMGIAGYHGLWLYCIIWSLNGFAQACGWPSNLSVMNNWFGKKSRGLVFSAWASNSNIGNTLGAVICGVIFVAFESSPILWQISMITCGICTIVGALPILLSLVHDPNILTQHKTNSLAKPVQVVPLSPDIISNNFTPSGGPARTVGTTEQHSHWNNLCLYLSLIHEALFSYGVISYSVVYACVKGVSYVYMYWMPFFLISSKGMTNTSAAYLSTLFDIGALIGGMCSGHVTDLLGSRTAVIMIMLILSACLPYILFEPFVTSQPAIGILLMGIGMSIGGVSILISASVALDLGDGTVKDKSAVEPVDASSGQAKPDRVDGLSDEAADAHSKSVSDRKTKISGTISGIIEGSGSAGAALLQYLVGIFLTCETEDDSTITCSWSTVLDLILVANIICLCFLSYLKFSRYLCGGGMKYGSKK